MLLKILGAIVVIWVAFMVLGAIFSIIKFALIVGVIVTVGALGYGAVKSLSGKSQKQIP